MTDFITSLGVLETVDSLLYNLLYPYPVFNHLYFSLLPLAIWMAHVMIWFMSISSLCSLARYSYRDPALAYSASTAQTDTNNFHYDKQEKSCAPMHRVK